LLPVPLKDVRTANDAWHIAMLDKKFPPFRTLQEPAELYQSVLVYRHISLEAPSNGGARILARLDDDEPLLTLRNIEKGRVAFWGTGVHVQWTNFPLRKIFLPLIGGLTFHLAGIEQTQRQATAGEPINLSFDKATMPLGAEVIPPSGETLRLKTQAEPGRPGQHFRFAETHQIGVYTLRILEGTQSTTMPFSVNYDPQEADPQTVKPAELSKQQAAAMMIIADNPNDLSDAFARLREGKSLWSLFLSGVLLALVFETFLSNRLSPKI
jgi:hypothetical protein